MSLVSLEEVKTYMDLKDNDESKDFIIRYLIPAAQAFMEQYCNRVFEKAEVTEYHSGGSQMIFLKKPPIDKTLSIAIYDDWQRVYGADTLLSSSDYFVDENTGIVSFDYPVGGTPGSIKAMYTGGYNPIPMDLRTACIELVARKVKEGPGGNLGVPNRNIPDGGSVIFVIDNILPPTKVVLDRYTI